MIDYNTAQAILAAEITKVTTAIGETFGLRNYPGEIFRVNPKNSYVTDNGAVMIYTDVYKDDKWFAFAKGTSNELVAEAKMLGRRTCEIRPKANSLTEYELHLYSSGNHMKTLSYGQNDLELLGQRAVEWVRDGYFKRSV
jgi:hypothetical protein